MGGRQKIVQMRKLRLREAGKRSNQEVGSGEPDLVVEGSSFPS